MPFFASMLPGTPGQSVNEPAFMRWLKDWQSRGAGNDEGVDYRQAFANGIEPDLDPETQTWKWPTQVPTGRSSPAPTPPSPVTAAGDDPAKPAPAGLLDRIAARMGDAGYGGGEDAKRIALRRALGAMGARMVAGSMKEGFGALAPAVSAGYSTFSGDLASQKEQRDTEEKDAAAVAIAAQKEAVQERYTKALTDQAQSTIVNKGDAAAVAKQKVADRVALIAGRREAVAQLDPTLQKRLAPLIGADDFDKFYYDATGVDAPAKKDVRSVGGDLVLVNPDSTTKVLYRSPVIPAAGEPKAPVTRNLADGTTAQWNPATKSWETIATKTGKDARQAAAQKLYQDALRDATNSLAVRVQGPSGSTTDLKATWKKAWDAAGVATAAPETEEESPPVDDGALAGKIGAWLRAPAPPAPPVSPVSKTNQPAKVDPVDVAMARRMAADPAALATASRLAGKPVTSQREAARIILAKGGRTPAQIASLLSAAGIQ